jgi:hypothetical protein
MSPRNSLCHAQDDKGDYFLIDPRCPVLPAFFAGGRGFCGFNNRNPTRFILSEELKHPFWLSGAVVLVRVLRLRDCFASRNNHYAQMTKGMVYCGTRKTVIVYAKYSAPSNKPAPIPAATRPPRHALTTHARHQNVLLQDRQLERNQSRHESRRVAYPCAE